MVLYEISRCIVQGIRDNKLDLAQYIKKEVRTFNPAKPDDIKNWHWPLSPRMNCGKTRWELTGRLRMIR